MANLKEILMRKKDKIDSAKVQSDQITGAINQLEKQLKDKFGVGLEEGEALSEQLESEISEMEKDITKKNDQLETEYDWS